MEMGIIKLQFYVNYINSASFSSFRFVKRVIYVPCNFTENYTLTK